MGLVKGGKLIPGWRICLLLLLLRLGSPPMVWLLLQLLWKLLENLRGAGRVGREVEEEEPRKLTKWLMAKLPIRIMSRLVSRLLMKEGVYRRRKQVKITRWTKM